MISKFDAKQTLMRVVESDRARWPVHTMSLAQELNLAAIARQIVGAELLHMEPLILEMRGSYLAFFEFGELVVWEGDASLIELMNLLPQQLTQEAHSAAKESFEVLAEQVEDRVTFHGVLLQRLSIEHIKVVSSNLAQSAALTKCDAEVGSIIDQWRPTVAQLASTGRMVLSGKELQSMIGKTLRIRESTIGKLAVVDSPQEAWKSERLSKLHFDLYEHFRFSQRVDAIEKKLQYLFDLNSTLVNILRHR